MTLTNSKNILNDLKILQNSISITQCFVVILFNPLYIKESFPDLLMKMGGCAAITACDCCIYFDLYRDTKLYPYALDQLTRKDYFKFGMAMKPYLHPRWTGIDKLEIYIDGFGEFLSDHGCDGIKMKPLPGETEVTEAKKALAQQIDKGLPIPCLLLNHKNKVFKDFEWHWFLLTGYEIFEEKCMVKAVSYGEWYWFDFDDLWNTSRDRKGGLILFDDESENTNTLL